MRYAVLVKDTTCEKHETPIAEAVAALAKFNDGLARDGVLIACEGLRPTIDGARLRFDGGRTTVTDGPFPESKELIGGLWIVQGKSREEIVERFAHAPMFDGTELEIRQLRDAEEMGRTA